MTYKKSDPDKTERVSISVGQMAIYVALLVGGLAAGVGLNLGGEYFQTQSIREKYQKLEAEYNQLKQDYDLISKEKYRGEYILHEGETIIDDTVGCTLKVNHIYSGIGQITGDLYDSNKTDEDGKCFSLSEAVPYDVFDQGKFSLTLTETTDDSCTIVFTEKTTE